MPRPDAPSLLAAFGWWRTTNAAGHIIAGRAMGGYQAEDRFLRDRAVQARNAGLLVKLG